MNNHMIFVDILHKMMYFFINQIPTYMSVITMNIQLTKLFSPNLANPVDLNSYILRSPKEIRKALELVASHPFGRSVIERSGEHEK